MTAFDTLTKKLNITPGINKNTTELDAEGTYTSCDKVRFFYGKPQKIGGCQEEVFTGTIQGIARDLHTWIDLSEIPYLGIGTHQKLQLFSQNTISDVTPIAASASGTDVLSLSAGSTEVIVSLTPTGVQAGDFFVFACVTACLDGVNFTSTYQVASVDTTYFTFNTSTTAVAGCANAGGIVVVDYLLPNGAQSNGAAYGWGAGTWDTPGASASAGWSDPRGQGTNVDLRQWSLDNWGEDLMAVPKGGKLYFWEASAGVTQRATQVCAAPSVNNYMNIAQEGRHVILYGTHDVSGGFDPMLVRWSDSEDYTSWTPAATNQSGEFRLENGSKILGAVETRNGILIFTDESVYRMYRVGGNTVFQFSDLGRHNGLASNHAAIDVNGIVYWMGYDSFMVYNGTIKTLPCSLQNFIFGTGAGSLNSDQKEKVYCNTLREFNEIWWWYPSIDDVNGENDRYVVYNYMENTWYHGTFKRTVMHDVDIFTRPYAIDTSGQLWTHEQGNNVGTSAMRALLHTSFFDLEDGDQMMFVDRIIPDVTFGKEINYTIKYKKYPQSNEVFTKGPFTVTPTTKKISTRIRGRQAQIQYTTSVQSDTFRIGADRVSLKPDGER